MLDLRPAHPFEPAQPAQAALLRRGRAGTLTWLTCLLLPALAARSARASEPRSVKAAAGQACSAQRAAVERDPQPAARLALCDCYAEAGMTMSAWSEARSAAMAAQAGGTLDLARTARARAKS